MHVRSLVVIVVHHEVHIFVCPFLVNVPFSLWPLHSHVLPTELQLAVSSVEHHLKN